MKRILSVLLAVALVCSLLPGVFAEDGVYQVGDKQNGFTVMDVREFALIGADVITLEHDKTGALVMLLLKRIKGFSMIGISIAGGVSHNIGQIVVAMCVLENTKLIYYLPVLMIAGTVTGILIGVVSRKILPAVSQGAGAERKNK